MPAPSLSARPRERGKAAVLAIIGLAAIALIGGTYYLIAIYLPGQKRDQARGEIARWEARFAEARACLLGETPAASELRQALAIRDLAPDPWNQGTCTRLISALSRGEADDTGMPAVEEAWGGIERAASKVGAAFLDHVDPSRRQPERLPGALEELGAAHAALRKTVDLPPPPPVAATPPLPKLEVTPLRDGEHLLRSFADWTMPTMGRVVGFGKSDSRELQVTLTPGAPGLMLPVGNGVLRTVPEAPWGASGGPGQILIGDIDLSAGLAPPPPTGPDPRVVKVEGQGRVFAVAGKAADGLVVAGGSNTLVLVRSQGGKLTADKPVPITELAFAIDPAGRALVAYNDEAGKLRGFVGRGGAPAQVLELGETVAGSACLTAKRAWIAGPASDQIISFDTETGAVTPHTYEQHDLLGCSTDAALLQKRDAAHFVVCADQCRVAVLQGMRPSSIATLAGDEVVSIALRDQVLGVWREKGPPRYFALPSPLLHPKLALSDGKVIDLVVQDEGEIAIVRIPAR